MQLKIYPKSSFSKVNQKILLITFCDNCHFDISLVNDNCIDKIGWNKPLSVAYR